MKILKRFLPLLIIGSIVLGFFYKSIFLGYIPFPGDLLVSEYKPWQIYSYLGYNPGAIPNKAQYPDTLRQLYPWKTLAIDQWKKNITPLWNPFNFSGAPLLANFQSSPLYPLGILYVVFSQTTAWAMLVMLQPFLMAVFTYFYCRKVNLGHEASLFTSISFGFSSFVTVWLEYNTVLHVVLWLPLILLSIEYLSEKITPIWATILIFSIVSSLFAGHPQLFTYALFFSVCYVLACSEKNKRIILLLFALSIGIGAVQILPGLELLSQSARSAHSWETLTQKILIQPWQLIMLIVPDFFGNPATRNYWLGDTYIGKVTSIGLLPLFFILPLFTYKLSRLAKVYIVTTVTVLVLVTANPLSLLLYRLKLPLISTSSPTLMTFLLHFSLSMLAGFGLESWRQKKITPRTFYTAVIPLGVIFIALWVPVIAISKFSHAAWTTNLVIARHNLLYSTSIFLTVSVLLFFLFKKPKMFSIMFILLLAIHVSDFWISFKKFNPFVPTSLVFPKAEIVDELQKISGIDRFWGYGTAAIEANFATQYQLFSTDGYDPLYPRRYGEFIGSSYNGKIRTTFTNQTRSDAVVAPGFGEKDFANNPFRLRVLDTLGVKFILDRTENGSTTQTFPQDRFSEIYNKDNWKILYNKTAIPRIFLASSYKVFHTNEEFEKIFFDKNFDPSQTIFLEQPLQNELQKPMTPNSVQLQSYGPNEINIKTLTDGGQLLFLSDTYYPGWKAFVDNMETRIYRANYAFRAIYIPKGNHAIRFVYSPSSFRAGVTISTISILLTLGSLGMLLTGRSHEKK